MRWPKTIVLAAVVIASYSIKMAWPKKEYDCPLSAPQVLDKINIEQTPLVTVFKDGEKIAEFDQEQSNDIISNMMKARFSTSESMPTYTHDIIMHDQEYTKQMQIYYNRNTNTIIIGEEVIWYFELQNYFEKSAPKMIGKRCYKIALLQMSEPIAFDEDTH